MTKKVICIAAMLTLTACSQNSLSVNQHSIEENASSSASSAAETEKASYTVHSAYVELKTATDLDIEHILELEDTFVLLSYPMDNDQNAGTFDLGVYNIATGELQYSLTQKDYPDYGQLLRIDDASEIQDYDYRMIFEQAVVYRHSNAAEREHEMIYELPVETIAFSDLRGYGHVDINAHHLTYATDEGIWLANRDGTEQKLVIPSAIISTAFPDVTDGLLSNPRWMQNGTKLVAGVYRTLSYEFTGAVIYDLASGQIESQVDVILPDTVVYPINDRYLAGRAWGWGNEVQLFDLVNGEIQTYTSTTGRYPMFVSHDYETIIVSQHIDAAQKMEVYLCDIAQPDDDSMLLLSANENVALKSMGITEQYVFFSGNDTFIAIKYQESVFGK